MSARIDTGKVLLITFGATMTVEQFRAQFMPRLTLKTVENRAYAGEVPPIRDGVMDTQTVGQWWESRCAATVPRVA